MTKVLIAAISPVMDAIERTVATVSQAQVVGTTDSVREAIDYCSQERLDAIIVDETLLIDSWGLTDRLSRADCPVILVIEKASAESARRALAMHAADVMTTDALPTLLPALLQRLHPQDTNQEIVHRIIGVYSAKGGVGKTTLAVNLAWNLAKLSGKSTALVDLDLQFGDVGPMVHDHPDVTIQELVEGSPKTIEPDKLARSLIGVDRLPLDLLLAPINPQYADAVESHHVRDIVTHLKASHVYTVCDLSSGLTEQNLSAMDMADVILLLATPEMITLRTVQRSLKVLGTLYPADGKIRLALNRADSGVSKEQIQEFLGLPVTYWMPSGGVTPVRSANSGKPLVVVDPGNVLAQAIENVAKALIEEFEGQSRKTARKEQV
ncbi:P-loop NTPase [Sulfobacillus sp. hq2]|uniref:Stage 0 sporulation protein A homolog n=1 Tax=Sulfobacillus thermotolerans TaxID=338644 RepID=A0ABM6RTH3_9FIRM|nr:P-loop NTPase [Sulfobacillus sp. hq2]AUW94786.1 hypothetical protein BXT84_13215 [Sulfobacillus thermotolerans]MCY0907839.1 AAA family ATPase [Sulfobacillus thermotolerans]POB09796.1 hypothetical protein CO251_12905 [Sulfobacillus sp. hq2]